MDAKFDIGDRVNLPPAISDYPTGLIVGRENRPSDMRISPRGGWVYTIQEIEVNAREIKTGGSFEAMESEVEEWNQCGSISATD